MMTSVKRERVALSIILVLEYIAFWAVVVWVVK